MFDKVVKVKISTCQESLAFNLGDKEMLARETSYILMLLNMIIIRCSEFCIALCLN